MKRSAVLVGVFLAAQLVMPIVGLVLRWSGSDQVTQWAWHMFSTVP